MSRSRWCVPVALSVATFCVVVAYPAVGAPMAKDRFFPAPRVRVGPATPGAQLWVRRYNGPGNSIDNATALGVSPDGPTVSVAGRSGGSPSLSDYATVAYGASTGTQLWVMRYEGPGNRGDVALALGSSPDGSKVFVTGESVGS